MRLRALFFDFDGLLCDTERAAYRSWEELYTEFGLPFTPKLWLRMMGRASGEAVALADLERRLGRPVEPGAVVGRRQRKFELSHQEPLRPGVGTLLAAADERGLARAVVSSSARSWVEPHLVRLGVLDRFPVVVTGDDVALPKPAPDVYEAALAATGTAREEVVAFEDSAAGVRAARAAGLRCVALPGSVGVRTGLDGADLVLEADDLPTLTFDELVSAMEARVAT
jgi:HAD superfamily hydrolase (TIGR01509 family)